MQRGTLWFIALGCLMAFSQARASQGERDFVHTCVVLFKKDAALMGFKGNLDSILPNICRCNWKELENAGMGRESLASFRKSLEIFPKILDDADTQRMNAVISKAIAEQRCSTVLKEITKAGANR